MWPFPKIETKSLSDPTDDEIALFTGTAPGTVPSTDQALGVAAVAAAVRTTAEAVATLEPKVFKRGTDEEVADFPALDLLRGQINEWESGYEFIRDLTAEALTKDVGGLAWVNRVAGKVVEIIHPRPGQITVQYDDNRAPTYTMNGTPVAVESIIHLRGPFGKCPISLARWAISAAAAMEQHANNLFTNGAKPGGIIEVPKGIGEKAWKAMKAGWKAAHEGPDKAGATAILFDGATFKQMTLNSTDAQFLELRRFQVEEIARAFGMSPGMLGDLTKSSYANAEQKQKEFLSYTLDPWLCAIEAAFNRALLNDDERKTLTFRFDRDDLTRASLTERATAINNLIASETINPNTGRDWLGLAPYDGGDEYGNRNITAKPATTETNAEANKPI